MLEQLTVLALIFVQVSTFQIRLQQAMAVKIVHLVERSSCWLED